MGRCVHLRPDVGPGEAFRPALEGIVAGVGLRACRRGSRELETAAVVLLANLLRARLLGGTLAFRRGHGPGAGGDGIALRSLAAAADALERAGLIVQRPGWFPWHDPEAGGRKTEAWPTEELAQLLADAVAPVRLDDNPREGQRTDQDRGTTGVPRTDDSRREDLRTDQDHRITGGLLHRRSIGAEPRASSAEPRNHPARLWTAPPRRRLVEMRDGRRRPVVRFRGTPETARMARMLAGYNALARGVTVVHVGADGAAAALMTDLHRVFNDGRWDRGGRFYGADHISLKGGRDARSRILIDGFPTAELDYGGLHLRLLYHDRGLDLDGDPYILADGQPPGTRAAAKLASIVCINAGRRREAIGAVARRLGEDRPGGPPGWRAAEELVRLFEARHARVRADFYSGAGLRLQNVDSAIAADVLARFVARGVVCLPVHDSFLVPEEYAEELREAMREAYVARMGREPVIT